ncbi:MAG: hypothetical protein LH628_16860, partial [Microcoleus sp. CAN_BIN18]|nr:hypothetical protein [Microcoleus sp. CAN_BIN18]
RILHPSPVTFKLHRWPETVFFPKYFVTTPKTPEKPGFLDFGVARNRVFATILITPPKTPEKPRFFGFDANPDKSRLMEIIGGVGAGLCRWLVSFRYCW